MTMVERVARAICENSGQSWESATDGYREICDDFARTAIEEMREPSDAMQVAGGLKCEALMFESEGSGVIFQDMGVVFTAMVDAAIREAETTR